LRLRAVKELEHVPGVGGLLDKILDILAAKLEAGATKWN
jgi:hypothetical protein